MQLPRDHVVATLRQLGRERAARRAEGVFGDQIDTVAQADLLRELGLDPDHRAAGGQLAVLGDRPDRAGGRP